MSAEDVTLVIRADRALLPGGEAPATVVVKGETIVAVGPRDMEVTGDEEIILSDGEVLAPGFVDSHVHINEPGRTAWEGYETATRAAAVGGITTVIDMPLNSTPPTVTIEALDQKEEATQGKLSVDVGLWGGAVPGNKDQLKPMWDRGVFGFKCFTSHSGLDEYGQLPYDQIKEDLAELAKFNGLLIVHAEDPKELADAPACSGPVYMDFLASRPKVSENAAIAKVIEAARETGGRVHLLHLASAEALPMLKQAKEDGVKITVETCPHYLTFAAEDIPDGATQYKCCPPLRENENRKGLWQGLKDGIIDSIGSDHSPATAELKTTGDFGTAWGGVSSVQLGFPAIWTAGQEFGITLEDLVRWFCSAPSKNFDVPNKGGIAEGNDADFAIIAPEETFVVDVEKLEHRNKISPYHGRTLSGVVHETILRGKKLNAEDRAGQIVLRNS